MLETIRLKLRKFILGDIPAFLAYRNDPLVARYQTWENISAAEAQAFIREQQTIQPGQPGEWFQFAIEHKEDQAMIGDCGLKTLADDARQAEIGFTLSRDCQGQGYATEAVTRLLDYAFSVLNFHRVVGITDVRNHPSIALLEKAGFRREGHFIQNIWFKGAWGDEYLYAILGEEWLNRDV
ncbi:MAG: GNAT family N-acetyltransferase [Anaerolineaceae bacterium]|nr:GNAT family N-acetyltransferase [Anaerolineaceae bacterium]